jgi:hypothetical protein
MSTTRWIASLVRDQPDLYRTIYDWNAYPHRWALSGWLENSAVPAPVIALLESSARGRERLSRHFRTALGLDEMLWDFQPPHRRLALLSTATLERLARFAGAALQAARLARVVAKEQRREITARIGEDAYRFALRRGRVLAGLNALDALTSRNGDLASDIETSGWRALATCVADDPPALRQRLQLKFPAKLVWPDPAGANCSAAAWSLLQPIAQEALSAEELRCFA